MSALTVELPDNLHEKAREAAAAKNLSLDTLVAIVPLSGIALAGSPSPHAIILPRSAGFLLSAG